MCYLQLQVTLLSIFRPGFLTVENSHLLWNDVEVIAFLFLKFRWCYIQNLTLEVHRVNSRFLRNFDFISLDLNLFLLFRGFSLPDIRVALEDWLNNVLIILSQSCPDEVLGPWCHFDLGGTLDLPDDRVEFTILNASDWSQHRDQIRSCFVLLDRLVRWIMMLLVTQ